jgi:hypothetical protein
VVLSALVDLGQFASSRLDWHFYGYLYEYLYGYLYGYLYRHLHDLGLLTGCERGQHSESGKRCPDSAGKTCAWQRKGIAVYFSPSCAIHRLFSSAFNAVNAA